MKKCFILVLSILMIGMAGLPALGSAGLGIRAMGMGGAFTAVADDESAFYWNPAGITQVRFASLMFGLAAQGEEFDFIKKTINKISDKERLEPDDFESGRGYFNLGLIGGITTRFVGVNFYSETGIYVENYAALKADASSYNCAALTIAGNLGEKTSIGMNVKKVVAGVGGGRVNTSDPTTQNETFYAEGDGFGYDLGILCRLNDQVSFGFIARNLGGEIEYSGEGMDYTKNPNGELFQYDSSGDLPRDYAVGVSYRPFKNTLLTLDIQKCDARENSDPGGATTVLTPGQTRWRIGFEQTALWNIIAFRLGAFTNKGESLAITAGLGLDLGPLGIGLAAVREEFNDKKADAVLFAAGIRF